MLDERYSTQTKAVDAAFTSQQTAMQAALAAAERAVATALLSAEKAVAKAEAATDKRFESVNEFREQLREQAVLFLQRNEGLSRMDAIERALTEHVARNVDQLKVIEDRLTERNSVVNNRLDLMQGRSSGVNASWGYLVGIVGLVGGFIGIIFALRGG